MADEIETLEDFGQWILDEVAEVEEVDVTLRGMEVTLLPGRGGGLHFDFLRYIWPCKDSEVLPGLLSRKNKILENIREFVARKRKERENE